MSSGGGGLWFLIRVLTEDHEKEVYGNRGTVPSTPATEPKRPLTRDGSQSSKSEEGADPKTRQASPPLEQVLRKTLEELRIFDALWILDKSEKIYQVSFTCLPGLPCDLILTSLTTNGIGICKGSSLIILPCTVLLQDDDDSASTDIQKITFDNDVDKKSTSDLSTLSKTKSEVKKAFKNFKEMQKKFLQTVTARLTVAQVVDGVRAGAEPTFDFIMFVLLASMIAALGLLENSSIVIVASMLISPIMGPILAGTFGAVIRDKSLRNTGIKAEIIGLFLCVGIGFLFGLMSEYINNVWGRREWPSDEMVARGQERSLWIGALIALPSGAGVALSVLAGNAGCLVGVAISASLLPPAVNAGLLWGMATVRAFRAQEENLQFVQVEGTLKLMKKSLIPYPGYEINYYPAMDRECAMLGLVSLGLALVNILCIILAALVVLKIKEVAPKTSVSRTLRFWKHDIKIARDYNTTMPTTEAEDLGKQFLAEWATLNGLEPDDLMGDDDEAEKTRIETLKDIMQDVESDEVFQAVAHSCTYGDNRPLSRRYSIMAASPSINLPPAADKGSRVSAIKSWLWSSLSPVSEGEETDTDLHPDLRDVELRRPRRPVGPPPPTTRLSTGQSRNSLAVLRHSLMNADSPYTLWPSVDPEVTRPRFVVHPVPEESSEATPQPIVRHRVSRFLQDPCVVVKETNC